MRLFEREPASADASLQEDAAPMARPKYYYRRRLKSAELLPVVGAAVGAAALVFYLARVFAQRTPLEPRDEPRDEPRARTPAARGKRDGGTG